MKKVLQDVLKDIEPYQLIMVSIRHDYWTLCREDAEFPIAISVKRLESPSYMYRSSYSLMDMVTPDIAEHYSRYDIDHTIEFDGVKMVIDMELLGVEYHDDYIKVTMKNAANNSSFLFCKAPSWSLSTSTFLAFSLILFSIDII